MSISVQESPKHLEIDPTREEILRIISATKNLLNSPEKQDELLIYQELLRIYGLTGILATHSRTHTRDARVYDSLYITTDPQYKELLFLACSLVDGKEGTVLELYKQVLFYNKFLQPTPVLISASYKLADTSAAQAIIHFTTSPYNQLMHKSQLAEI